MECCIDDLVLHYEEYGAGKPVLCLHGFPEDLRTMTGCLEPVFQHEEGYRRIYLDLPGMGKSQAKPWLKNADNMLNVINQFIDKIIKDESFLVIGLSYGGYLTLGMMLENKTNLDGVFLVVPCTIGEHKKRNVYRGDYQLIDEDFIVSSKVGYKDFLEYAVVISDKTWQRYQDEILVGLNSADETFIERYQGNGYSFSFEDDLKQIEFSKPLSVIVAKQDNCVGYQDSWLLLEHLEQMDYILLGGAGHNLQIEYPEAFNSAIKSWLIKLKK